MSKSVHTQLQSFMTYPYNQYGYNDAYYKIQRAKWIVYTCSGLMLRECVSKKLMLVCISFGINFNQSIEAPSTHVKIIKL
jgi:hypothetical protein